jgi:hypothetical protein
MEVAMLVELASFDRKGEYILREHVKRGSLTQKGETSDDQ